MDGVPLDTAAAQTGIAVDTLRKRLQRGGLEGFKQPTAFGEAWYVSTSTLEKLKAETSAAVDIMPPIVQPDTRPEVPAPPAVPLDTDARIELAMAAFDYFTDSLNYEIDHRNQPVFSVERLRRDLGVDKALGVDKDLLAAALSLLERETVIGSRFNEPNVRAREMRVINQPWLERGCRDRLLAIFKPQPSKPHIPWGAGRVLQDTTLYVGKQLVSFNEGDIVRDERQICALLAAGAAVAKLEETSTRMCADPKCSHRYDESDSPALDYKPLMAIRRDSFFHGGTTVWLNPGDIVTDRSRCLFMTTGNMKERTRHSVRELAPDEYECCPRCNQVQMRKTNTRPPS